MGPGPFRGVPSKLKGTQKRGSQTGKEGSLKGRLLPKDFDEKLQIQTSTKEVDDGLELDMFGSDKTESGPTVEKRDNSGINDSQKETGDSGKGSFSYGIGKEPNEMIYTQRSLRKSKTRPEQDSAFRAAGICDTVSKMDNSNLDNPRSRVKGGKQRTHKGSLQVSPDGVADVEKSDEDRLKNDILVSGITCGTSLGTAENVDEKTHAFAGKRKSGKQRTHKGRLQEAPVQAVFTENLDEGKFKGGDMFDTSHGGVSAVVAVDVEKRDSRTNSSLYSESSDLHTSSLSLSLGLNRIKTRSGPLYGEDRAEKHSCLHMPVQVNTPSEWVDDVRRIDSLPSAKERSERSTENLNYDTPATSSDSMSRDRFASRGRFAGCKNVKLQRSLQMSRNAEGIASAVVSRVDTCGNPLSSMSQPLDCFQSKTRTHESHGKYQRADDALDKTVTSGLASYLDSKCNKVPDMEGLSKQLDGIKETESTRFQAVPRMFGGSKKKKWPKDIKSFSHELGPIGSRPYGNPRSHSDNDLEELLVALQARFNTAKEEVDSELAVFAADLVEILDKNVDSFPEWEEKVEDLLVLARRCAIMSPADFRRECENIVQELDDKRQELCMGLLKQLHTRMLFILTRCTRLLQFQKGVSPEEEGLHKVQQCLKGVPRLERTWSPTAAKKGKAALYSRKLLPDVLERCSKPSKHIEKSKYPFEKSENINQISQIDSLVTDCLTSSKDSSVLGNDFSDKTEATDDWVTRGLKDSTIKTLQESWDQLDSGKKVYDDEFQERMVQSATPSKQVHRMSWGYWSSEQENMVEELDSVICRICEDVVPTSHLEAHSFTCALADSCDVQGLSLDERLRILADNLERITEMNTPKSSQLVAGDSPDMIKTLKLHDVSDGTSPKLNDGYGKVVESRLDDFYVGDTGIMEEPRGLSLISFKPYLGAKSDQGMASSSAGSGTPRSALTTPRNSQLDLLWVERSSLTDLEDVSQIYELADIARCVANKSPTEHGALEYLVACMQDLQEVLGRNKIEALTVGTFGKHIENLVREKYLLICENTDQRKLDSVNNQFEEDVMSADEGLNSVKGTFTDDGLNSLKSTPTHPANKDRTTIDDFEILKPISRGAFGRVFLARKRTTGDLFAIKVLRKIDMIRKNAVENIVAERDILISLCNPFVVRFFYSFTCRENLYLVMEYLNGGDLYSLLRNMGCLEEHVARVYIAELVLALEYLHSLGVVHRDLKPDNVLIAHDGHIKLTDFGLSKVGLINSTDDLSGPAASGTVLKDGNIYQSSATHSQHRERRKDRSAVGTPDYLAPEILLGTEHGYTADWWSTGIIVFECLTGLPPFNAEHPQIIFDNILNRKIPWPRTPEDMSFEAYDLIDRLLTEDPNQRLGAKGASEVKAHPFFKDINWDTLARQKAAFIPNLESVDDTSYFTSRHLGSHSQLLQDFGYSSDLSSTTTSMNSLKARGEEGEDSCGDLAEFESSPSVRYTFNNFSFKNLSQLASINYDLLSQTGKDSSKGHSRQPSAS